MQEVVNDMELQGEKKKNLREQKWLMWLLKIWQDNDRRPTWIMIKRNWPEEYQSILDDIGPWNLVEQKLDAARLIQNQAKEQKMVAVLRKNYAMDPRQLFSLEEHIQGLIKLMEYLEIERLPTYPEIKKYTKKLGIPPAHSYTRVFVSKENWQSCIQDYLASTPDNRSEVLEKIETKLLKQREEKWQRSGIHKTKHARHCEQYDRERCLQDLSVVCNHFGCIPASKVIADFVKGTDLVSFNTMVRYLGPRSGWDEIFAQYQCEKEIEAYLETAGNLKVAGAKSLNRLFERFDDVATVSEKIELDNALGQINRATKKTPAKFTVELAGREYEIAISPKG